MLISKELDSKFQKNNPIYCSKYSQFVYPDDCKAALGYPFNHEFHEGCKYTLISVNLLIDPP